MAGASPKHHPMIRISLSSRSLLARELSTSCALVPRGFEFRGWGGVATEWWVGFPSADSSHRAPTEVPRLAATCASSRSAPPRAPPVRVAYKNLCFGGFVQTWEQALALVERVAMPHLGLLPDTFNMAGAVGSVAGDLRCRDEVALLVGRGS
ncbi:uncharacterized protein B0I36DRAFT_364135 [Microdochium trichocladiopsis]|uniref:Uncharacterized protein n=1 Tax=Microdochium trichocladiopsis TaxID=1682393 RepID=A0A9P8Y7Q5_9PEZI|nr:uncharacterized protein B0I36DRAFT_364135 [Microdochium trichocladiopsis]KAH7029617.1 hypothetical protein B0I36DRAFT_364135 [Microdochium trichocladiopsis]